MAVSVYIINKGVNRPVEFKGLKGFFIWFLFGAIGGSLILYGLLYMLGINQYLSVLSAGLVATISMMKVFQLNRTYGEHGLMKRFAFRSIPKTIRCQSRKLFYGKKS